MNKLFLGIDPGQAGGICLIRYDGITTLEIIKMPYTERDVWTWIGSYSNAKGIIAVIEKVHAMPGNGVSSMFKFGMGYGGLRMALIAASIPFGEVTPQKWMKEFGITRKPTETKSEFKQRLKSKAQSLFPQENSSITLSTCDALLISEYCRRKHS